MDKTLHEIAMEGFIMEQTDKIFCIGNGESRKDFDLNRLKSVEHSRIYGCNALYRDFKPDVLVAVDKGIMDEIYESGYTKDNETWFRNRDKPGVNLVHNICPGKSDIGWACGAMAAYIGIKQTEPEEVYMIGHDFRSNNNKLNNLYKDTKNYNPSTRSPIPADNWLHQWGTLLKDNPDTKFFKVNQTLEEVDIVNTRIEEFKEYKNLEYITYEDIFSR